MLLSQALNEKEFDLRLMDKYLAEGKITQQEWEKHLAALKDDEENLERTK